MLDGIKEVLVNVQNELSNSVQKFRINASPSLQSCSSDMISSLLKTQAGSNLLLKYQLNVEQIQRMNNENIRLANLCSTRMGSSQQMCNERSETILAMHEHIRAVPQISKQLKALNRQIDKLSRFCMQTELALTHLDALHVVAIGEKEIENRKAKLKIDREELRNQHEKEKIWLSAQPGPNIFCQGDESLRELISQDTEKREEVMLEEFLSR